jgi:hypothetical protein
MEDFITLRLGGGIPAVAIDVLFEDIPRDDRGSMVVRAGDNRQACLPVKLAEFVLGEIAKAFPGQLPEGTLVTVEVDQEYGAAARWEGEAFQIRRKMFADLTARLLRIAAGAAERGALRTMPQE